MALPGLVPFFFFFFFGLSVPLPDFFGTSVFGASGFASGFGTWRWSSLLSTGIAGLVALAGAAAGVAAFVVVLAALDELVAYVELAYLVWLVPFEALLAVEDLVLRAPAAAGSNSGGKSLAGGVAAAGAPSAGVAAAGAPSAGVAAAGAPSAGVAAAGAVAFPFVVALVAFPSGSVAPDIGLL